MRVILLRDIPKIGKKLDIREVPDGYARNLLIPKGLVKEATEKALGEREKIITEHTDEEKLFDSLMEKNFDILSSFTLQVKAKTNDGGHLFASIHKEEILKALKDGHHIELLPQSLLLEKPLKITGLHEIPVALKNKKSVLKVEVIGV